MFRLTTQSNLREGEIMGLSPELLTKELLSREELEELTGLGYFLSVCWVTGI